MKYQIYLSKEVSEIINGIAKAEKKKPASFIKEFLETSFKSLKVAMTDEQIKVVKDYGKRS